MHLGFAAVIVAVAVVLWSWGCRRWRPEAERAEEIRKMKWISAEESARAEAESFALAYLSSPLAPSTLTADYDGGVNGGPRCAVCYRATKTRCSRCKAVRYCSGKCQIIHWRRGHKDECHPPRIEDRSNDGESESSLKGSTTNQSSLLGSVELERTQLKPVETSSARPSHESNLSPVIFNEDENKTVVDVTGTDSTSDSLEGSSLLSSTASSSSSSGSTFSGFLETSDDASSSDYDPHHEKKEKASCHDISPEDLTSAQTCKENPKNCPPEVAGLSVNNLSCTSNNEQMACGRVASKSESSSDHLSVSSLDSDNRTTYMPDEEAGILECHHVQTAAGSSCGVSSDLLPSETRYAKEDSSRGIISSKKGPAQCNYRYDSDNHTNPMPIEEAGILECDHVQTAAGSSFGVSSDLLPSETRSGKEDSSRGIASSKGPAQCNHRYDSDDHTNPMPIEEAGILECDRVQTSAGSSCGVFSDLLSSETRSAKEYSSYGIVSSKGPAQCNHRLSSASGAEKSTSVSYGRSTDVWLLKAKNARSPSSFLSVDHKSFNGGTHSVSRDPSLKNGNTSTLYTQSVKTMASATNGTNDLKTSVSRVVQQLKSSHLSKHSSAPRNDVSWKHKVLFPYDLFVKLYNFDKVEMRPCGLTNCGNSCYANAVLQCLAFTRPLNSYLLQGLHAKTCPRRGWCFTCEFASLLVKANQGQSPLSPIGILSQIHNIGNNLGHGRQEDAHEFLRYAIDTMQSVCLKEAGTNAVGTSAEETTLVQLIFGGYLRSKIKCTRCRGKSERHERMMDLTVEIHGDIGTLEEALARFTTTEILDGDNKYHCSRCKSYERAKKKLTVLEAPNILTIALKRFQSGNFGKLNKAVRFPEILDLAPYMSNKDDKSPIYSLYAVVVHQDIMNAAFSGHYVCYVKSTQGKWYKTDDSRVKRVDIGRVLANNAYMLLYARCSPRAPSLVRNFVSHNNPKITRNTGKDSHDFPPDHQLNERARLPFPRTDSSSDNSSLFSFSDECSCSTESTRDSTSTEELSEFSRNSSSAFSEDSFDWDGEWLFGNLERRDGMDGLELAGEKSPRFLYSDTTNRCRNLTGDDRRGASASGSRERRAASGSRERARTFY